MDSATDFQTEIAPSRTFVFVREIQKLREAGLLRGSLDNAIVIYEENFLRMSLT